MRSKVKITLIIILALILPFIVFMIVYHFVQNGDGASAERSVLIETNELRVGDTAPDFTVELLSGEEFTLSGNKGKIVFLNFWATWCPPCVAEMPAIQELSEKYTEIAVFIGINCAENEKRVRDFIDENGFSYNIGLDEEGVLIRNHYPSNGIPYTLVIDADGIITAIFLGGSDQMYSIFESAILEAQK